MLPDLVIEIRLKLFNKNGYILLTSRVFWVSAADHFDFWICYRGPKNKKYVCFYFSPFSYLGGENCVQS